MENLRREAEENLRRLAGNPYPGRGIILGRAEDGRYVQFYWIMGRSENSQNRVFVREGETVRTEPFLAEKMEDPSLVIYTAMNVAGGHHIVSNGNHTDALCRVLGSGGDHQEALRSVAHEPDEPHFTPRIAGGLRPESPVDGSVLAWLGIVKADPFGPERSQRFFYEFSGLAPGYGWCITTYRGDGTPLPSFTGEPFVLPLQGDGNELLGWIWYRLNERTRVSLALKIVGPGPDGGKILIVNKNQ